MRGRCGCLDLFLLFKGYEECCLFFLPPLSPSPKLCVYGGEAGRGGGPKKSLAMVILPHPS